MIVRDLESLDLGFDIVIIGAGAAGCALAANLSEKFKILLVDRRDFPRKKACSGVVVKEGIDYFGGNIEKYLLNQPNYLDITYVDWDNALEKVTKKGFWNSDRFALDNFLFDSVRNKKNVHFVKHTSYVEFTTTKDNLHKVIMLESNGEVKPIISKYLVGCDGALSKVRAKVDPREIRFYIGLQEFIKSDIKFDKAYFIFDDEITDFYSWIIPKGPYVEIGSLLDPKDSNEKFLLLKKKLHQKFNISGDGVINSAIVLRPKSIKDICLGKDSVILCGEAAGLISPSSAEGISYALRSGKYCAEAFNSGQEPLKEYTNKCKELFDRLNEKFAKSKLLSEKVLRKKIFS